MVPTVEHLNEDRRCERISACNKTLCLEWESFPPLLLDYELFCANVTFLAIHTANGLTAWWMEELTSNRCSIVTASKGGPWFCVFVLHLLKQISCHCTSRKWCTVWSNQRRARRFRALQDWSSPLLQTILSAPLALLEFILGVCASEGTVGGNWSWSMLCP